MAYSPPSSKSKYGDTDFYDDNWSQDSGSPGGPAPPYQPRGQAAIQSSLETRNQMTGNYTAPPPPPASPPFGGVPPQQTPSSIPNPAAIAKSLTPEDMLFMRSWQRDSFYYRVLPLSVIGNSAVYIYYKSKGAKPKISRFFGITIAAWALGKLMYRDELKQRLATSSSNTPFMEALRKSVGLTGASPFGDVGYSSGYSPNSAWNTRSEFSTEAINQPIGGPLDLNQDYNFTPPDSHDLLTGGGSSKQGTSYDELRARNRGLVK